MRSVLLIVIVVSCITLACKQKQSEPVKAQPVDTTTFFQVKAYLQTQINEVHRTPYYMYKIRVVNGKRDSVPSNINEFDALSKQFTDPDINSPDIKPYYKETVFEDQTTKSYTVSYTTQNKELPIQGLDILIDEDGKTVKRIFIRKFYDYKDSSAIEQLSWKPAQSFMINRAVLLPNDKENDTQTMLVWNEKVQEKE